MCKTVIAREDESLDPVSPQEDPYVMLKEDGYDSTNPNDRFEGFCVDLLAEISNVLHFNYSIHLVADGQYGSMEGIEWTGMIRELMDKASDALMLAPSEFGT